MERVEDFAEETGVYGLNLMRQRVPRIEKVFWIGLTIIFTGLTINDLREVIKVYAEGETLTSVSLNDESIITFDPPPTVLLVMREAFVQPNNVSNDSLLSILE